VFTAAARSTPRNEFFIKKYSSLWDLGAAVAKCRFLTSAAAPPPHIPELKEAHRIPSRRTRRGGQLSLFLLSPD
jgi:hypothetical protein